MQGVPIKFRCVTKFGDTFYSVPFADNEFDYGDDGTIHFLNDDDVISQLCAFDANGKEIYEGDTVYIYYTGALDPNAEFVPCRPFAIIRFNQHSTLYYPPEEYKYVLEE